MLLAPFLEASATGASHLPQNLTRFQRVLAQTRYPYCSETRANPYYLGRRGFAKEHHENKQFDSRIISPAHTGVKKILAPYDLSQRVDALCRDGNLAAAISLVKSSPLDAQNAIVWATLIRSVLAAGRYQEAYRLFTDMKRRGIKPTSRTFSTLLKGYALIDDWEKFPLQLDNVCSLYTQVMQYHTTIEKTGGPREELSNIPYNLLINIFGKAQSFQRMFDVFNAMPSRGPLAPDMRTFTFLITSIGNRQISAISRTPTEEEGGDTLPTAIELAYKNASDARLIWRQLLRVFPNPDSHAIRAMFKPLSRGRPSDQTLVFEIAHEHLGLSRPGEQSIPAKLQLHPLTIESLLMTSNITKRYRYTLNYIQQIIDSGRQFLLTRRHMDHALQAHAALACMDPGEAGQALELLQWMLRMQALPQAPELDGGVGPQIRPTTSTYDIVVLACWNGGDWPSACRTFELMTGYSSDQFRGEMHNPPKSPSLARELRLCPSAIFMSSLIRMAAKTHDHENVRQALNILDHYGVDAILEETTRPGQSARETSQKREKNRLFHAMKLVEALHTVLPRMLTSPDYDQSTKARWKDTWRRAEQFVPSKPVRDVAFNGKRQSDS